MDCVKRERIYRGRALFWPPVCVCVCVPKGTGAHLEKKRGQHKESAIVMDLATSGVAQDLQKTHVWTFSQMNHAAVHYSLANDSSESS